MALGHTGSCTAHKYPNHPWVIADVVCWR
jgi:hypothetical protein